MNLMLIPQLITINKIAYMTLKKMGTHFSPNGYYIFSKWVPILPPNGYPFWNYIVGYRIKYSGDIKNNRLFKIQIIEY